MCSLGRGSCADPSGVGAQPVLTLFNSVLGLHWLFQGLMEHTCGDTVLGGLPALWEGSCPLPHMVAAQPVLALPLQVRFAPAVSPQLCQCDRCALAVIREQLGLGEASAAVESSPATVPQAAPAPMALPAIQGHHICPVLIIFPCVWWELLVLGQNQWILIIKSQLTGLNCSFVVAFPAHTWFELQEKILLESSFGALFST